LKFIVKGPINPYPPIHKHTKHYEVVLIQPSSKVIAKFEEDEEGINKLMAHDYCDFLNDKYCDKEVNKEWPKINRLARINYHLEQLSILINSERVVWGEHGNEVKEGSD